MANVEFVATLKVSECNGYMNSHWYVDNKLVAEIIPTNDDDIRVRFGLTIPGKITVVLSGKNMLEDTKLDSNGNIVKDKFISIKEMSLAKVSIPEHVFKDFCEFDIGTNKLNTSYYGFPGTVTIVFDEEDPILWHFKHNHYKKS